MRSAAHDVQDVGSLFDPADLPADVAAAGRRVARSYRVALDWSQELGFTAVCVELPALTTRAADATPCVEALYDAAAAHVASLLVQGHVAPGALRPAAVRPARPTLPASGDASAETRLCDTPSFDARFSDAVAFDFGAPDAPPIDQLRRMAAWTAAQYRLVLHWSDGTYYASCPEVPFVAGFGRSPGRCAADIRRHLTRHVADVIAANRMPPEPLQEIERRVQGRRTAA